MPTPHRDTTSVGNRAATGQAAVYAQVARNLAVDGVGW